MAYFHDIDPVMVQLGPVTLDWLGRTLGPIAVHWYGLMYLCGFGAAYWLGIRRLRIGRLGITAEQFSDLLFAGMLGVIIGGRIGYMLVYGRDELIAHPLSLFKVWEGGMSFHGGLAGVVVTAAWWSRKQNRHAFDVVDFLVPLVPIGLGLGRIGNWIGGELWGRHTDVSWGVIFPKALDHLGLGMDALRMQAQAGLLDAEARHPSQLYQAVLEGIVLFFIVWFFSAKPRRRYAVSGMFSIVYGLGRFLVEFVREPDRQMGFVAFDWMTTGQLLSIPLILLGVIFLWMSRTQPVPQFAVAVEPAHASKAKA